MAVVKQSTFSIVADYSSAELTFECRFWSRGPKWPGGCGEAVLLTKAADYSSTELAFECRFWSRGPKWPGGCGEAALLTKAADYSSTELVFECRFWSRGSQMALRPHWIRMGVVGLCNGNGYRASQQAVAVS